MKNNNERQKILPTSQIKASGILKRHLKLCPFIVPDTLL
jgi:hypothetical protein